MSNPNEITLSLTFDMSTVAGRVDYDKVIDLIDSRTTVAYEAELEAQSQENEYADIDQDALLGQILSEARKFFGVAQPEDIDTGSPIHLMVSPEKQNLDDLTELLGQHPALAGAVLLRSWAQYILSVGQSKHGFDAADQHINWHIEPGSGLLHIIIKPNIPDVPKGESTAPLSEDTPAPGADDEEADFFD